MNIFHQINDETTDTGNQVIKLNVIHEQPDARTPHPSPKGFLMTETTSQSESAHRRTFRRKAPPNPEAVRSLYRYLRSSVPSSLIHCKGTNHDPRLG
jgi:hypothetical protein